jgi:hypothetical protein
MSVKITLKKKIEIKTMNDNASLNIGLNKLQKFKSITKENVAGGQTAGDNLKNIFVVENSDVFDLDGLDAVLLDKLRVRKNRKSR